MSILPQLERDLRSAALRHVGAPAPTRRTRLHLTLAPLLALLAAATVAVAATTVILEGSPVSTPAKLTAGAGLGLPSSGGARLLSLRVADPDGGLPWGMRIVRTSRGAVCIQIGRVQGDQLGEIGVDGAFANDGLFHPLPSDVLPPAAQSAGVCDEQPAPQSKIAHAQTNSSVETDTDLSATLTTSTQTPDRRVLNYGLLGFNAISIIYRDALGVTRSAPLNNPYGAYLFVAPAAPTSPISASSSLGTDESDGAILNPDGNTLLAVTYRIDGHLCSDQSIAHLSACPPPGFTPAPNVPRSVRPQPLHARLALSHGQVTALSVQFVAPLAVTSLDQSYMLATQACPSTNNNTPGAIQVKATNSDIKVGTLVTLSVAHPFARACLPALTATVTYSYPTNEENVTIGSATITRPR